ncbi:MAG: YggS family pyridoxal phosphate-dependent enzyme, partial [Vallitaleaceae bacterium]|nr:YggS family pyridoxal phosphate-dependent enzyme [Vallitaleaceae bacterium]
MSMIKQNLETIQSSIQSVCKNVGKEPGSITLIAVTKTKPIEAMKEAIEWGILHVGENKVQEIVNKYELFHSSVYWHMIGHLQTNKVKMIVDKVALIHSVDSYKLAEKINEEARKIDKIQDILIQVNIADEETKFGVESRATEALIREIALLKNVKITGLMTIAPYVENPEDNRLVFRAL